MDYRELSSKYVVRKLNENDVERIYDLAIHNLLFYKYCPPVVTKESILSDMQVLPPKKTMEDKYYLGFFEYQELVAVMDLIYRFPNEETVFVGFFMVNQQFQKQGIGSYIIKECYESIKKQGYHFVRLGYAKGNPQSESFWKKNGFIPTGVEVQNDGYTVVVMEKAL